MNDSQTPSPDNPDSFTTAIKAAYPRMAALLEAHPEINNGHFQSQATAIAMENGSLKSKRKKFFELADVFNKATGKYAVCQKGCAHCCYMPTMIYAHEAEILGQATGIKPAPVPYRDRSVVLADAVRQFGPPCPFLGKDNGCTVYDHRPLICRLHHSMNNNPDDCVVSESGTKAPIAKIDADVIEAPYHALVLRHASREPWGTIQMFFPNRS